MCKDPTPAIHQACLPDRPLPDRPSNGPATREPADARSGPMRRALRMAVALQLALAATMLAPSSAQAQETVRIALIDPLSGPFAPVGEGIYRQFQYVVDLANNRQWAGKDIRLELIAFDGLGSPQESVDQLRSAIGQGIHYVVQGNGSAVAMALVDAIGKHNQRRPGQEVVYFNYGALDPALTNEKCSFWQFRLAANADQKMEALTSYLRSQSSVKKVYLLNQDYALGRNVSRAARDMLRRKRPDVEIVGDEFHPIGQIRDFAGHVEQIRQAGADTVITGDWGADLALLIQAARDAKLPANIYTYHANVSGVPAAVGAYGDGRVRYIGTWAPNERSFGGGEIREDFAKKGGGDFYLKQSYDTIRLLAEGIKRAGTAAPVPVALAMEGLGFNSLAGPVEMRAADHQLQQAQVVASWHKRDGKTVRVDDEGTGYGWRTESIQPGYVGVQPTSCTMARPAGAASH